MKKEVLVLIVLSSLFQMQAMDSGESITLSSESTDSQDGKVFWIRKSNNQSPLQPSVKFPDAHSQDENSNETLTVLSPRNILINAIYANNELGVAIALFNYQEVNLPGTKYGHDDPPLCVAAGQGRQGIVECLLGNGAQTHITDVHGDTALHYAVRFGHLATAKILYENGASLEARNIWDQTVLLQALDAIPLQYDLIEWLLKKGANVNAVDDEGNSVAHYAYRHDREDILDLLDTSPIIEWEMLNEDGLKPNEMTLLDHYVPPPPPPPLPPMPERTISYADIDELLGYFYKDTIKTTLTTLASGQQITTHYYLLDLGKMSNPDDSNIIKESTDDSSNDNTPGIFFDAVAEFSSKNNRHTTPQDTDDEFTDSEEIVIFYDPETTVDASEQNAFANQAENKEQKQIFFNNLFNSNDPEKDSSEVEWDDE